MSEDKRELTKEEIDYIHKQIYQSGHSTPALDFFRSKLTPEQLLQKQKSMDRLKELQESFDKKYIEEMFDEGVKSGALPNTINQYMRYEFNGWIYEFKRFRKV